MHSCTPAELQYREEEEEQFLISSQIQHHLNQASKLFLLTIALDHAITLQFQTHEGLLVD